MVEDPASGPGMGAGWLMSPVSGTLHFLDLSAPNARLPHSRCRAGVELLLLLSL